MATVFDVASHILEQLGPVSHMKLQKLVYYSQAWAAVWEDRALFPERIEAWANGPVSPALFAVLRGRFAVSAAELGPHGNGGNLTPADKDVIGRALAFYGDKDSQWLSDLTHMESPWLNARAGLPPGIRSNSEITLASMSEYYGSL